MVEEDEEDEEDEEEYEKIWARQSRRGYLGEEV
jgi:hypothetical protein